MLRDRKEFELKFEMPDDGLKRLRSNKLLREIGVGRPVTRMLRSIYFDTADLALRSAGLSLRIRRNQSGWLQTVTENPGDMAGACERLEIETPITNPLPDLAAVEVKRVRKRIRKTVGQAALEPVFETAFWRTTRRLQSADGSKIKIAFDRGEIRGADRAQKICEVELELISGRPHSVFALAEELFAGEPPKLSQMSKAERGYRLGDGPPSTALEPKSAQAPRLTADQTTEQAFRRILRSCIDQVLHNVHVVIENDDLEGPHQLRIGLRRLRCALRAHMSLGDKAAFQHLGHEARDLGRVVSTLRDVDVAIDEFFSPYAMREPCGSGEQSLMAALASHQEQVRRGVRNHLASGRVGAFELALCALMEDELLHRIPNGKNAIAVDAPVDDHARRVLQNFWSKVSKLGNRLDKLSIAERHEMRKALKNLRYVAEFYAPLYPGKSVRRYLRRLKQLQTIFGYLNDVELLTDLRDAVVERQHHDAELNWTIGRIQGAAEVRAEIAWASAHKNWHKLQQTKTFWS